MSLSLYQVSTPVFARGLGSLAAILAKGEAHAAAHSIDPADLTGARLAADMFPLTRQVHSACDAAKFCAARLSGTPAPSNPDTEQSFAELQERIAVTLRFIEGIGPEQIDGREEQPVVLKTPSRTMTFTGRDYLLSFALPNFFFHLTTAYDILRHRGVPLGKLDYLGAI